MRHLTALRWLPILATNLFGLALLYLGGIDKLGIYIHPSSHWFVLGTGLFFIIMNIVRLFRKEDIPTQREGLFGALCLLLAASLILTIKPTPLSVETARIRISDNNSFISGQNTDRFATRKTSDFGIVDWLAAFANPEESFRYENMPADISGFLLIQDNQPFIGRLVITCCGADAQPVMIRFDWPGDLPEQNTWVQIKGLMHAVDSKPVLMATSLETIDPPRNPYAE